LKEIESVFSVYKIAVDFRHLTLIADYMVRSYLPHLCPLTDLVWVDF
jgi:hypothetical protein